VEDRQNRIKIQLDAAKIGLRDARESYQRQDATWHGPLAAARGGSRRWRCAGRSGTRSSRPRRSRELSRVGHRAPARPHASGSVGSRAAEADVRLAQGQPVSPTSTSSTNPTPSKNNQPYGLKSPYSWAMGRRRTVPMPRYNRNQGTIATRQAETDQTQVQLMTLSVRFLTDVENALREYEVTREAVRQVREGGSCPRPAGAG